MGGSGRMGDEPAAAAGGGGEGGGGAGDVAGGREPTAEEVQAATKVQAAVRGQQARQEVAVIRAERTAAATAVQRSWRERQAGREARAASPGGEVRAVELGGAEEEDIELAEAEAAVAAEVEAEAEAEAMRVGRTPRRGEEGSPEMKLLEEQLASEVRQRQELEDMIPRLERLFKEEQAKRKALELGSANAERIVANSFAHDVEVEKRVAQLEAELHNVRLGKKAAEEALARAEETVRMQEGIERMRMEAAHRAQVTRLAGEVDRLRETMENDAATMMHEIGRWKSKAEAQAKAFAGARLEVLQRKKELDYSKDALDALIDRLYAGGAAGDDIRHGMAQELERQKARGHREANKRNNGLYERDLEYAMQAADNINVMEPLPPLGKDEGGNVVNRDYFVSERQWVSNMPRLPGPGEAAGEKGRGGRKASVPNLGVAPARVGAPALPSNRRASARDGPQPSARRDPPSGRRQAGGAPSAPSHRSPRMGAGQRAAQRPPPGQGAPSFMQNGGRARSVPRPRPAAMAPADDAVAKHLQRIAVAKQKKKENKGFMDRGPRDRFESKSNQMNMHMAQKW